MQKILLKLHCGFSNLYSAFLSKCSRLFHSWQKERGPVKIYFTVVIYWIRATYLVVLREISQCIYSPSYFIRKIVHGICTHEPKAQRHNRGEIMWERAVSSNFSHTVRSFERSCWDFWTRCYDWGSPKQFFRETASCHLLLLLFIE